MIPPDAQCLSMATNGQGSGLYPGAPEAASSTLPAPDLVATLLCCLYLGNGGVKRRVPDRLVEASTLLHLHIRVSVLDLLRLLWRTMC